ncbi:sulfotransferase family 2 domain-containing protein [Isoptericola aurantiacus]|uniref:sulfotransferase family 2 domain-containing protein n=1 Tax=Isoptericola aurantiacus TaxID=3377839 RepID=UPI003839E3D0
MTREHERSVPQVGAPAEHPPTAAAATEPLDSFVLWEQRVVFVAVAKNASTSIKWLLADLTGQDRGAFRARIGLAPTRWQTVHARSVWQGVPTLHELTDEQRSQISPANGWFVFSVVRDPRLRAWSAWQSKFLSGNPTHTHTVFEGEPWLPRVPESADDVVEDFARFVTVLGSSEDSRVGEDDHFVPQWQRLGRGTVPYSRLYDMSEVPELLDDLGHHLAQHGHTEPLVLGRENSTPLPVAGRLFTPEVKDTLDRVYADDFEHLGDRWDFDTVLTKEPQWSRDAFRDIAARVAAGGQIADLSRNAKQMRSELRTELRDLKKTARSNAKTIAQLRATRDARDRELAKTRAANDTLREQLRTATTETAELRARNAALETALHHRTLRGLPRAVLRRARRALHGSGSEQ